MAIGDWDAGPGVAPDVNADGATERADAALDAADRLRDHLGGGQGPAALDIPMKQAFEHRLTLPSAGRRLGP